MKKLVLITIAASAAVASVAVNENKIYTDNVEAADIDLTGLAWVKVEDDVVFDKDQDYDLYLDDSEPVGLD